MNKHCLTRYFGGRGRVLLRSMGKLIPDCEVSIGWACIYRVRSSDYGCLEMLKIKIVVRRGHWRRDSQV